MNLTLQNKGSFLTRFLLIGVFLVTLSMPTWAQEKITVSGKILDNTNEPLPGAAVLVQGSKDGTQSDINGEYVITVNSNAVLEFSFIGYKSQSVSVNGRAKINVTLEPDAAMLQEVVAIGYGSQRKEDLSMAVSSVKMDNIMRSRSSDLGTVLQGRLPGVTVQKSGDPMASTSFTIRGRGSKGNDGDVNSGDGVLFVVDGRKPGQRPFCLIDYFQNDFITFIDESHVTIPQIRAMYGGDHSRKSVLIEYGFRLPAASDNRPLTFDEFEAVTGQTVFVSATPSAYELSRSEGLVVEQVVRPTGLLDPPIEVRPTHDQVDNLLEEIRKRAEVDERVLVTTLTKRMAEELDDFFGKRGVRCRYIHSDVDTAERVEIIEDFKNGLFDVLIGVNLLREGLDIPSVSLVAILDADKEGFLRSQVALTQTAGRAARNIHGLVIMYADSITKSMQETIYETDRRRAKQIEYNRINHITPKQVEVKHNALISELGGGSSDAAQGKNFGRVTASNSYDNPTFIPNPSALGKGRITVGLGDDSKRETNTASADGYIRADLAAVLQDPVIRSMSREQIRKSVEESKRKMKKAAADLDYAAAARYRDEMWALEEYLKVWKD